MSHSQNTSRKTSTTRQLYSQKLLLESLEPRTLLSLTFTPYTGADNGTTLANAVFSNTTGFTINTVSYIGQSGQAATYSGFSLDDGTTQLAIPDGILLTSGLASSAFSTEPGGGTQWGTAGDSNLTTLVGSATHDANSLTINFTSDANTHSIGFNIIFGSYEYPVYVGSNYNDVFGAYLDGTQLTFDTQDNPVTVNNNYLNLNNSTDTGYPSVTNAAGTTAVNFRSSLTYQGLTNKLTTNAPLIGTTHTLKIVIADDFDDGYDSGAFISGLHGSSAILSAPTTNPPSTPDISVSSPTALASTLISATVPVSWTVSNVGTGDTAGSWSDKVYWHRTDASQPDQLLDTVSYTGANLTAGSGSYTISNSYAAPSTPGTYELLVTTGNGESMTESPLNNSASSSPMTVTEPNLIISSLSAPTAAAIGQSVSASWTVTNTGSADTSGTWSDKVYWHRTDVSQTDQLLDTINYTGANLTAGSGSYTTSKSYAAPTTPGTYVLLVTTGNGETMTEDTSDNSNSSTPMTVAAPDLSIFSIVSDPTALAGQSFSVSWIIQNIGAGTTFGTWSDKAYWHRTDVSQPDQLIVTVPYTSANLAHNDNYTVHQTITAPSTPGTYELLITTGNGETMTEDTSNNSASSSATTVTAPDLTPSAVTAPSSGFTNQSLAVSWTVTNTGSAATSGLWVDKAYWHRTDISQTDTLAGLLSNTTLAINASYTIHETYAAPTTPGTYVLLLTTGNSEIMTEDTSNNSANSSSIIITLPYTLTLSGQTRGLPLTTIPVPFDDTITLNGTAVYTGTTTPVASASLLIRVTDGTTPTDTSVTTDSHGNFTLTINPTNTTTITYTATARAATLPATNIPAAATLQFQRLAPPSNTLTPQQTYVDRVYQDLLGRTADAASAYWSNLLTAPGGTPLAVTTGITNSTEYRTDELNQAYQSILGRPVDQQGLTTWLHDLSTGQTIEQIKAAVLGSSEYQTTHATSTSFLQSIYQLFLNRNIDTAALTYWSQQLTSGTTRNQTALTIEQSPESIQDTIKPIYQTYLNRAAITTELTYWTTQIQAASTTTPTLAAILGSTEYYQL